MGQNNDKQYTDVIYKNSYDNSQLFNVFGPNHKIEFWAQAAQYPDAEYWDFYTYEISINPELSKKHQYQSFSIESSNSTYLHDLIDDKNNEFGFIVASADPWFAKRLINFSDDAAKQYFHTFMLDSEFDSNVISQIRVAVSGGTEMPENPDHELSVFINDQLINSTQFEAVQEQIIQVNIPQNVLKIGENLVTLKLTEGTGAVYDIVNVYKITLSYARNLSAIEGVLLGDPTLRINLDALD